MCGTNQERNTGNQLLRVEGLEKEGILQGVSFQMEPGEMLAVMGPSGSGKSTLLYQTAGMDRPSGGRVWLKDTEITGLSEDEKARIRLHRMGFVFQQMNMIANLNLLDNILLPALQANKGKHRRPRRELEAAARELMGKLSLGGLEGRRITQVSGGQLQRACICRSMINGPEILFADEPTGALNSKTGLDVLDTLTGFNEQGQSVVMVTHDMRSARRGNRILYLKDGAILGECNLGRYVHGDGKRHEELSAFLAEMGW